MLRVPWELSVRCCHSPGCLRELPTQGTTTCPAPQPPTALLRCSCGTCPTAPTVQIRALTPAVSAGPTRAASTLHHLLPPPHPQCTLAPLGWGGLEARE